MVSQISGTLHQGLGMGINRLDIRQFGTGYPQQTMLNGNHLLSHDVVFKFHQQIIDLTNRLNPRLREYFSSFLNDPVWNYGGTGNGANGKATLDGKEWTWSPTDKLWHGPAPYMPIDNAEMQRRLSQTANAGGGGAVGAPGAGTGNKGNGGNGGPKASDYKNHYNTGNAAPKQVIVRIDKLMNVESVDLSNPDNAAVIANLKSELTQALVDVVHDFDETWNG